MEDKKQTKLIIWVLLVIIVFMVGLLAIQNNNKVKEVELPVVVNDEQAQIELYITEYVKSQGYGLDYYSAGEKRLFALSKNPFINGSFYINNTN